MKKSGIEFRVKGEAGHDIRGLSERRVTDELEEVYRDHRRGLFALAVSITGSSSLAEDAVHDAFANLCRRRSAPSGDLVNYVFAAVRNAARDIVRRRHRSDSDGSELFHEPCDRTVGADPAQRTEHAERQQQLQSAVLGLDAASRESVILKIYAGLTFDAIGEITGEPPATVATRYRRALLQLQNRLQDRV